MCGPLHLQFEDCEHVLDSGQLERCQQAFQNNTVCEGDAVSQTAITQYHPGLCPYCAQGQPQDGSEGDATSSEESSTEEDDDEDDVTTMHPSEGRSRQAPTSRASMLHPRGASQMSGSPQQQPNYIQDSIPALQDPAVYYTQQTGQPYGGYPDVQNPQMDNNNNLQSAQQHHYRQPYTGPQLPQQQYMTEPAQSSQLGHRTPGHDDEQGQIIPKVRPPRQHVKRRRRTRTRPVQEHKKTGWLAEKLLNWRSKPAPANGLRDGIRDELAQLEHLRQDKDIAAARQRAKLAEERVFQHDTQRAIAASKPSERQLKRDDEKLVRQAMLNSINDYTEGLERQLKQGKAKVRIKYTQCGHEGFEHAAGFAAEAGYKPNVIHQDALCDDCYLKQHRQAQLPRINVEAPSSSTPGPAKRPKQTAGEAMRSRRREGAQRYYVPSESPTQPAEYARTAPSFASGRRSRADPNAMPEFVAPLPTIAGSRAPSVARVMQNRANEEATRQRLFEMASEAGSSALSAVPEEMGRPTGAEVSAKKAGKQRAL